MRNLSVLLAGLPLLFLVGGCQKLSFKQTVKLEPMARWRANFDPPTYDQDVTVEIKTQGSNIAAFLGYTADVEQAVAAQAHPKNPIAQTLNIDGTATLKGKIDAKKAFSVLLINSGSSPAEVTVNVSGK
ncbi:MAG: hypothetical protein KatS3mg105_1642 [Gemmatales bacterium]|nr:MAG: hypothetical protein KatS3mg105_1642 [Gemmatales bacterium]